MKLTLLTDVSINGLINLRHDLNLARQDTALAITRAAVTELGDEELKDAPLGRHVIMTSAEHELFNYEDKRIGFYFHTVADWLQPPRWMIITNGTRTRIVWSEDGFILADHYLGNSITQDILNKVRNKKPEDFQ